MQTLYPSYPSLDFLLVFAHKIIYFFYLYDAPEFKGKGMFNPWVVAALVVALAILIRWKQASAACEPRILDDVLFVFAHPDDEAMFFSPILDYLRRRGLKAHFLCFSNGNHYGLGAAREEELHLSAKYFKIHRNNLKIVNHPALQDGMDVPWDTDLIRQEVFLYLKKANHVRTVVTFDRGGVSHHPNHVAVYNGVSSVRENMPPGIVFLSLRTRSLLAKYIGVLAVFRYIFAPRLPMEHRHFVIVIPPSSVLTSFRAMRMHKTQLVWFRYLFVAFSSYTYVNEMDELTVV